MHRVGKYSFVAGHQNYPLHDIYPSRAPEFTPYCDVRYDFRIWTMFDSSLPPVVWLRAHVLFTLFVFVCVLHCVFALFSSSCVLFTQCCQFLWIVNS